MTLRHSLFTVLLADLLMACGGQAAQMAASTGGAGGTSGAAGGQAGGGGHTSGGTSASGGSSSGGTGAGGGAMVCCDAFPVCPTGERTAQAGECPGLASCHELSVCCSSIWCVAAQPCFGTWCTATQACIAYRIEGGVRLPPDAGACSTGEHLEGPMCQEDFAYKCAELHGACQNQPVTCACAEPQTNDPGVCPVGYGDCSKPGPSVDSSAQLVCEELVP